MDNSKREKESLKTKDTENIGNLDNKERCLQMHFS